jgi:hypothetical protein
MFMFELSCKIKYFQKDALMTKFYEKVLALYSILKDT